MGRDRLSPQGAQEGQGIDPALLPARVRKAACEAFPRKRLVKSCTRRFRIWPTSRYPTSSTGRRGVPWWRRPPPNWPASPASTSSPRRRSWSAHTWSRYLPPRDAGLDVFHVVLDASEEILRQRIQGSAEARAWRLDHLAEYRSSRAWMIRAADLAVDTGGRTPAEIAHQIASALPEPMRPERPRLRDQRHVRAVAGLSWPSEQHMAARDRAW